MTYLVIILDDFISQPRRRYILHSLARQMIWYLPLLQQCVCIVTRSLWQTAQCLHLFAWLGILYVWEPFYLVKKWHWEIILTKLFWSYFVYRDTAPLALRGRHHVAYNAGGRFVLFKKGRFVYSAVSSHQERSKRFTLYFPDRPVHSDSISASLGSIQPSAAINARSLHVHICHIHHCL